MSWFERTGMTRVPADEQRLREIEEALAVVREGLLPSNTYSARARGVGALDVLVALLRLREQEAAEARHDADLYGGIAESALDQGAKSIRALLAERDAAVREAAELRAALREIAKGESYYVGDYMTIARAALEATDPAAFVADPAAEEKV